MPSFNETWVGRAPAPANDAERRTVAAVAEDVTSPELYRRPSPDATVVERLAPDGVSYVADATESSSFTTDMVEELRRRLREAEAREESGVRLRPTPEEGIARPAALPSTPGQEVAPTLDAAPDPLADLEIDVEIDVEEPRSLDEIDEVLSAVAELEVALAPNSESNFYAGFDDEHPDGIFVATYATLPADTPVYVDVHLPGGYRFRTAAMVEWTRGPEAATAEAPAGIGLKMCGLDHRMRRLIRTFARHRKPIFYVG